MPASTPVAIHATRDDPVPVDETRVADRAAASGAADRARRPDSRRLEPIEPLEQNQRLFAVRAALDRRCQQRPRDSGVAAVERRQRRSWTSSSPSRCRSAMALRARSM